MTINIVHISRRIYLITKQCVKGRIFQKTQLIFFLKKRYNWNHITEMNTITIAKKLDTSYDFYFKHNMETTEWKLKAMINNDKSFIKKLNRNWRHLFIRKINHVFI